MERFLQRSRRREKKKDNQLRKELIQKLLREKEAQEDEERGRGEDDYLRDELIQKLLREMEEEEREIEEDEPEMEEEEDADEIIFFSTPTTVSSAPPVSATSSSSTSSSSTTVPSATSTVSNVIISFNPYVIVVYPKTDITWVVTGSSNKWESSKGTSIIMPPGYEPYGGEVGDSTTLQFKNISTLELKSVDEIFKNYSIGYDGTDQFYYYKDTHTSWEPPVNIEIPFNNYSIVVEEDEWLISSADTSNSDYDVYKTKLGKTLFAPKNFTPVGFDPIEFQSNGSGDIKSLREIDLPYLDYDIDYKKSSKKYYYFNNGNISYEPPTTIPPPPPVASTVNIDISFDPYVIIVVSPPPTKASTNLWKSTSTTNVFEREYNGSKVYIISPTGYTPSTKPNPSRVSDIEFINSTNGIITDLYDINSQYVLSDTIKNSYVMYDDLDTGNFVSDINPAPTATAPTATAPAPTPTATATATATAPAAPAGFLSGIKNFPGFGGTKAAAPAVTPGATASTAPSTGATASPSATGATAPAPSTTATAPASLLQNIQKAKLKKAASKSPPDSKPRTKPLTQEQDLKYTDLYKKAINETTKDNKTNKIDEIKTEMKKEKISTIIIDQFIEEQKKKYAVDTSKVTDRRNQIQDDSDSESESDIDIDGQSKCVIS